jgi:hypothetical protein
MTDENEAVVLKLRADLDEATKQHMPAMVVTTEYLRAVLDTNALLRAEYAEACSRRTVEARTLIASLRAENERVSHQASKLWALLVYIDTLDDSCRGNDYLFRTLTRAAQQTRYAIMTAEEWYAARADPARDTLADSDGDDGA